MIDCLPCSKLFSRLTSQMVKRGKPSGAPGYRNVQYDTLNTPSGWNSSSPSPSPVSAVCTSCTRWHERWRWRGSPCSHWCHSPWWCTGPGADRRWLPPCLAWDRGRQRDKRRGVKGNNCSTLSCRWERNPDDTKTGTSPQKNNCHISHILYTNLGWTTFLYCICNFSFLFWQLGKSVWEGERREVVYLG